MPIHDWTRSPFGYFHHFHQRWSGNICDALNGGLLPGGFFALVEQREAGGAIPDVLTLNRPSRSNESRSAPGGVVTVDAPPRARFIRYADADAYAARANRVIVRNSSAEVVAAIEIVSPGNKSSVHALRAFATKSMEFLRQGINLLVIDLFPPSSRDPQGIHKVIWDQLVDEPFDLPPDKPLTLAAYAAGSPTTAYIEPVAVGDALPDMPVFLAANTYVSVPLEATYQSTWVACPMEFKQAVE